MSQQTQPNASAASGAAKAAAAGALFVLSCALSIYMPLFALLTVVLFSALLQGGRARLGITLYAVGFAVQVLISGSFLFAALYLLFVLICTLPALLFHKRFSARAHFDGVMVQCASVALSLAALYGVMYLLMGAEPIHAVCSAMEAALLQDSSQSASELLRLTWEMKQVVLLSQSQQGLTTDAVFQLLSQASTLTHAQLATQTEGFFEFMARNALPTIAILLSSVGGLLCYALPARWLSRPTRGMGRFLGLNAQPSRPLPPFSSWQLPRDIGSGLFIAVILLLALSFAGVSAVDNAMVLVYTLFSAVFYIQGLCSVSYLLNLTKLKRPARIILTCVAAPFTSIVSMLGTVDYVVRLRTFMDFSRKMKDAAAQSARAAWPEPAKDDEPSDDAKDEEKQPESGAPDVPDVSEHKNDDNASNSAHDAANKED